MACEVYNCCFVGCSLVVDGEFVLVVEGASESAIADEKSDLLSLSPEEHIEHYINEGLSKMDAIKAAAKDRGVSKSEMYKYSI